MMFVHAFIRAGVGNYFHSTVAPWEIAHCCIRASKLLHVYRSQLHHPSVCAVC